MIKTYKQLRTEARLKSPPKLVRLSPNINFLMRAARDRNSPQNPRNQGKGRPSP